MVAIPPHCTRHLCPPKFGQRNHNFINRWISCHIRLYLRIRLEWNNLRNKYTSTVHPITKPATSTIKGRMSACFARFTFMAFLRSDLQRTDFAHNISRWTLLLDPTTSSSLFPLPAPKKWLILGYSFANAGCTSTLNDLHAIRQIDRINFKFSQFSEWSCVAL